MTCTIYILAPKPLESSNDLRYNNHTKRKHPLQSGCLPIWIYLPLNERRPFPWPTGWALFFSLISLVEKGKQRNDQTARRYQQSQYPEENHNDFIIRHVRHLPSYVFRRTGFIGSGGYHPVMGTFCKSILSYHFTDFNNIHFQGMKSTNIFS